MLPTLGRSEALRSCIVSTPNIMHKYRDTINEHLELGLSRPYFAVFSSDSAAILLKNGLYGRKIPLFDNANLLCPGT